MSKRDAALSALVSLGIAATGTIVASQLDLKLEEATLANQAKTQASKVKPDSPPRVYETVGGPKQWDQVYDVVVVGSGAAGLMAGISALWTKPDLKVLVLESTANVGGTTSKSGGVFWLPNNIKMDVPDDKEQTLKMLARMGFPKEFDESKPYFGLDLDDYSRLAQFYDLGRPLSEQLQRVAFHLTRVRDADGRYLFDYTYSPKSQPDNVAPQQRHLAIGMPAVQYHAMKFIQSAVSALLPVLRGFQKRFPALREVTALSSFGLTLSYGFGLHLIQALEREFINSGNGKIKTGSTVDGIVLDEGSVVGVRILNAQTGTHEFIGARRGVVFASGGYSQDQELIRQNLISQNRFVFRTGASEGNTGAFFRLADKLGAKVDEADKQRIWGCETVFDESAPWETPTCLFQFRGDSFFVVGPNGKRVYNEKGKYDRRARAHWTLPKDSCADPSKGVFFAICDARCQDIFGGQVLANSWPRDPEDPLYTTASTMAEMAEKLIQRYPQYVNPQLLKENLRSTFERFNEFARKGQDEEFGRGAEFPSDEQWTYTGIPGETSPIPNRSMYPLSSFGPYYALPIVASIIDTKGGPWIDAQARVVSGSDDPIDRLYAAGNCAHSLTGDVYVSGGSTLGAALVSGYVAGMHAVLRGPGGAKL